MATPLRHTTEIHEKGFKEEDYAEEESWRPHLLLEGKVKTHISLSLAGLTCAS